MSEQADKPKHKRRWFRFRLRTLLIAMLLLGVGMGLVGMRLVKYRRANAAVEWIKDAGGRAGNHYVAKESNWWEQIFHDDFVDSVNFAILNGAQVSDLSPLRELTQLQVLYLLNDTQVSDLSPLRELIQLQVLYLQGTQVSDLTPLKKMKGVKIYLNAGQRVMVPEELKDRVSKEVLNPQPPDR